MGVNMQVCQHSCQSAWSLQGFKAILRKLARDESLEADYLGDLPPQLRRLLELEARNRAASIGGEADMSAASVKQTLGRVWSWFVDTQLERGRRTDPRIWVQALLVVARYFPETVKCKHVPGEVHSRRKTLSYLLDEDWVTAAVGDREVARLVVEEVRQRWCYSGEIEITRTYHHWLDRGVEMLRLAVEAWTETLERETSEQETRREQETRNERVDEKRAGDNVYRRVQVAVKVAVAVLTLAAILWGWVATTAWLNRADVREVAQLLAPGSFASPLGSMVWEGFAMFQALRYLAPALAGWVTLLVIISGGFDLLKQIKDKLMSLGRRISQGLAA